MTAVAVVTLKFPLKSTLIDVADEVMVYRRMTPIDLGTTVCIGGPVGWIKRFCEVKGQRDLHWSVSGVMMDAWYVHRGATLGHH
jgi:hypothetical protein